MVPDPGGDAGTWHGRRGQGADEASRFLDDKSQPGTLAGRHFVSANQTGFHRPDGAGYQLFVETVLAVEKRNPQVAARLATALRSWRSLEPVRQAKAREALLAISSTPNLSADLRDIIERTLA